MAEKAQHSTHHEKTRTAESGAEAPKQHEHAKHHEKPQTAEKHYNKQELEKLAEHAEKVAKSSEETSVGEAEKQSGAHTQIGIGRDLKLQAYQQTLQKVRTHLKPAERAFSKVIHQPVVEAVSEVGAKTLARPSGILGGGFVALVGGSVVLFISKYFGFEYNFFVYLMFLVIGFFAGVILEFVISGVRSKRSSS